MIGSFFLVGHSNELYRFSFGYSGDQHRKFGQVKLSFIFLCSLVANGVIAIFSILFIGFAGENKLHLLTIGIANRTLSHQFYCVEFGGAILSQQIGFSLDTKSNGK